MPAGQNGADGAAPSAVAARAWRSTDQSIADSTDTAIIFDTEVYDTSGIWEGVTNPSRLTIPEDGIYHVGGHVSWEADADQIQFEVFLRVNDDFNIAFNIMYWTATDNARLPISSDYTFVAGDYVELFVFQSNTNSSAVLCEARNPYAPALWLHKI